MVLLMRQRYQLEAMRGEVEIAAARSGGGVKNLNSVFAAYMIGWGIFFVYYVSVAQSRRSAAARNGTAEEVADSEDK